MLARQQERAVGRRLCESGVRGNREGDSGCVRALRCFVSTQAGAPCSFAASLGGRQKAVRLRARRRLCQSGTRGSSCRCPGSDAPRRRRESGRSRWGVSWAKRRRRPWKWQAVKSGSIRIAGRNGGLREQQGTRWAAAQQTHGATRVAKKATARGGMHPGADIAVTARGRGRDCNSPKYI